MNWPREINMIIIVIKAWLLKYATYVSVIDVILPQIATKKVKILINKPLHQ